MARKPRIHRPGGLYHVMLRGNAGQQIFFDDADKSHFCLLIQEGLERFGHTIYAFCLMTNHVHLLVRVQNESLSRIIQNLSFRYAHHVNRRFKRAGHLFQGRFKSILVQENRYFKELIRYIHLNPVRANLVARPEEYLWSGHRTVLGYDNIQWLAVDKILSSFGEEREAALQAYIEYIYSGIGMAFDETLKMGSHEGRLLGDNEFAEKELSNENKQLNIPLLPIDRLIKVASDYFGIPVDELVGPSRERKFSRARGILALLVRDHSCWSLTDLAQILKRDLGGISKLARKTEKKVLVDPDLQESLTEIQKLAKNSFIKSTSQA